MKRRKTMGERGDEKKEEKLNRSVNIQSDTRIAEAKDYESKKTRAKGGAKPTNT